MVLDKNTEHLATFHLRSKRHEEKKIDLGVKNHFRQVQWDSILFLSY